jgi:hypothetical protein
LQPSPFLKSLPALSSINGWNWTTCGNAFLSVVWSFTQQSVFSKSERTYWNIVKNLNSSALPPQDSRHLKKPHEPGANKALPWSGFLMLPIIKLVFIGLVAGVSLTTGIWIAIKIREMDQEVGVYDGR